MMVLIVQQEENVKNVKKIFMLKMINVNKEMYLLKVVMNIN